MSGQRGKGTGLHPCSAAALGEFETSLDVKIFILETKFLIETKRVVGTGFNV